MKFVNPADLSKQNRQTNNKTQVVGRIQNFVSKVLLRKKSLFRFIIHFLENEPDYPSEGNILKVLVSIFKLCRT
jgi:hypothetical protein